MQSDGHVVQRRSQTGRHAVSWLTENISAPDDVGVLGFERRQDAIKAITDRRVELLVDRKVLNLCLVDDDLSASPSRCFALMVDDGRGQDSAEPSAHHPNIVKL